MYLLSVKLADVPPFGEVDLNLVDDTDEPQRLCVIYGSGGVGKSVLLSAIATTRPGHSTALFAGNLGPAPRATCCWHLGQDEPGRPHPLVITTPNAGRSADDDEATMLQRREQTLYERRSKAGGFVFLLIPTSRWFSRQPVSLQAPMRTVVHYDVRAPINVDDPSRNDLTRETKQALLYGAASAALARHRPREQEQPSGASTAINVRQLSAALHDVVNSFLAPSGFSYAGVDPVSLEPLFVSPGGRRVPLEGLPTHARHLVAIATGIVRALWAGYPGHDPREREAVIAVDDIDLFQEPATQERLPSLLRETLPQVQWLLTTSSATLAHSCNASDLITLRRLPENEQVALFRDAEAQTH